MERGTTAWYGHHDHHHSGTGKPASNVEADGKIGSIATERH